ncbi:lysosomal alpha-glucosidase-like isoform X1 [Neodiprion pinetum]|uniref:lysosomal alpha-glucosidase-like isoform X1 n=2 Tax=Neodiprion pinetum TaxID=441929 RepID=UPI001EE07BBC|nr:lysosomal alpha-glucosidase-like isoform X2 [Neodiprion pinetum]XP_046491045.1 lysosomal alpha-glucosidase-like isoform X2 [Neodiprion pinetum]XP_046491046.1 lysosomal alpha-glucosidase-like isoform X2 [Neodiprion pinetum]XP_046491047.1 lysosomal alpha-glucosidase-like isoform X2 [Neodiprion pinetum]
MGKYLISTQVAGVVFLVHNNKPANLLNSIGDTNKMPYEESLIPNSKNTNYKEKNMAKSFAFQHSMFHYFKPLDEEEEDPKPHVSLKKRYVPSLTVFTRVVMISFVLASLWYLMAMLYGFVTDESLGIYTEQDVTGQNIRADVFLEDSITSNLADSYFDNSHLESRGSLVRDFIRREPPSDKKCRNIPKVLRFDCYPQDGATKLNCENRGCCWNPPDHVNCDNDNCSKRVPLDVPYCYYPEDWTSYQYFNMTPDGNDFSGLLRIGAKSSYKNDIGIIKIESTSLTDSIIRVKISDPDNARYEPPWPVKRDWKKLPKKSSSPKYIFEIDESKAGFAIRRASDKTVLFNSIGIGGFTFSDQFLQIHSILPSYNIYGLGEHRNNLRLDTNWQSFTMFNSDQPPTEKMNLYGSHPFYLVMEESGMSHGVLFLNSNAMDVILQPAPAITFRTIGGIFDLYFFMGPTPADVLRQYSEIVGKPFMPPYWSLGFHLCKYGYKSLAVTKEVWNRTRNAKIPFDTQWNDIDYMDRNNDFTYDKKDFKDLPEFVDELHSVGMHYIPIIDAGLSASEKPGEYLPYDEGLRERIFVKDSATGQPFVGKVWNLVSTVWPDFTNPMTSDYYLRMLQNTHKMFAFDGIWIDMNEPSNFYNGRVNGCTKNDLDYPQYVPNVRGGMLASRTFCMDAQHHLGLHYNLHNTHGIGQAVATNFALKSIRNKRPFIISRSTWAGFGYYAGHWTGDILSDWHDLRMSIPEILSYSLFQVPMVGADICGFRGNTTPALCNRWSQLGAFYPFSRNHNSDESIPQDPVAMGDLVVHSTRKALMIRYRFLPYLYTLFFKAHKFGDTVARPLFIEFTNDKNTYDIDKQFLWGSSLMIIPVLEENKVEVTAYIPRGPWYDFYTKAFMFSTGFNHTLKAPMDTIPLMIRGGSILPAQTPSVTTTQSRKKKFELLVALDENGFASGELYWDDGDSLDSLENYQFRWLSFTVQNRTLRNREVNNGYFSGDMILGKVSVMGVGTVVDGVYLNGNEHGDFTYDIERKYLNITGLGVDLKTSLTLSWVFKK